MVNQLQPIYVATSQILENQANFFLQNLMKPFIRKLFNLNFQITLSITTYHDDRNSAIFRISILQISNIVFRSVNVILGLIYLAKTRGIVAGI